MVTFGAASGTILGTSVWNSFLKCQGTIFCIISWFRGMLDILCASCKTSESNLKVHWTQWNIKSKQMGETKIKAQKKSHSTDVTMFPLEKRSVTIKYCIIGPHMKNNDIVKMKKTCTNTCAKPTEAVHCVGARRLSWVIQPTQSMSLPMFAKDRNCASPASLGKYMIQASLSS